MFAHWVWLKTLKPSNRNWMRVFSVKLKFLNSDMLKFAIPGP